MKRLGAQSGHNCKKQKCQDRFECPMTAGKLAARLAKLPKNLPVFVTRHSTEGWDDGGFIVDVKKTETLGLGEHIQLVGDITDVEWMD